MQRATLLTFGLVALVTPAAAHAQDAAACKDAYDRSQTVRDQGHLLEARKLLRTCASAACSRAIQADCAEWLAEVESRIPSVVLSAKDGRGADLIDVQVSLDGVVVATRLDGRAIDVDPGPHKFLFEASPGGAREEKTVLVAEREKGVAVASALLPPVPVQPARPEPAAPPPPPPEPPLPPPPTSAFPPVRSSEGSSGLQLAGWVVGGVGVGILALGVVGGLVVLSDKNTVSQECNALDQCSAKGLGAASDGKDWAAVGTVAFIAGGLAVAGGITMIVLGSGSGPRVALGPQPGGGALRLSGAF